MFVIVPRRIGLTTIVTVAPAPLVSVPRLQVTTPPASPQVPAVDAADMNSTSAGSVSVSRTLVAANGPSLATATV